ncbi:MAG: hypothetical protein DRN15_06150 [Thermoprotei archaeon]|nr:MAG: hypothetical protein DRM97_07670 [Thermoprotei archaeon]RLF23520.1 MAG: hypothetical protein DRN15_06150 [Thermoprotei archaeon]
MSSEVIFVIEHLEPVVSRWVWYEYLSSSRIIGRERLLISNVKDPRERAILRKIAMVSKMSILKVGLPADKMLILDPKAPTLLRPDDFKEVKYVVIGGIMGDHPPRGRTWTLLTSRLPGCIARNLGPHQFSVDGAVYMAHMVMHGYEVEEIPIRIGLEIKVNEFLTIELPYAYPLINGRPLISKELVEYLKHGIEEDEVEAIRSGRVRSIAEFMEEPG